VPRVAAGGQPALNRHITLSGASAGQRFLIRS
jgi:hypothetical protein